MTVAVVALVALVAIPSACRRGQTPSPPREEAPLSVEVSGCAAIVRAPGETKIERASCALSSDRALRVFVPGEGPIELQSSAGAIVPATPLRAPPVGGDLLAVRVPDGISSITIRRRSSQEPTSRGALHTLSFVQPPRPAWYAEAQALRERGKLEDARELARRAAVESESLPERAAAEGILARIAMRQGKVDESAQHFEQAIALDERAGLVSDRVDDALAFVFLLHKRTRRYSDARRVLDEIGPALDAYPDGRAREPLYRGQLAWETGDTRAATRLVALAIERSEKLGANGIARAARQVRAMIACSAGSTHACVGALREADEELRRAPDAQACERAEVGISLGFAELEEADLTGHADPLRLGKADERGIEAIESGCPDPYMRAVALEHLAMAAVLLRDATTARARLREAKALAPEPRSGDAVMWLEIEARAAELEGAHRAALAAFDAARALARGAALRTQEWRALVGRGRVLESTRRVDEAVATYREAEAVLDEVVALVPFGEGRASAAADGGESMRRLAKLLVDRGDPLGALEVVRHARGRLVHSLAVAAKVGALEGQTRERWEHAVAEYRELRALVDSDAEGDWKRSRAALEAAVLARASKLAALRARLDDAMVLVMGYGKEAPPPLPPSETVLAFARLGTGREVVGFVVDDHGARAYPVGSITRDMPLSALGERMLAPAIGEISRAKTVRVIADDALGWIDVHALPLGDAPLVTRAPVVYGADLSPADPARATGSEVLVVADPTGDLPSARAEGAAVAQAVADHARPLVGRDATAARVRAALGSARLFHYAGHGVFRGREGAESALPLAQGGALTLGDVLTLERVPRDVILSGCEAGRQQGGDEEGAASMALAFLIAGAETVVAPVRIVEDRAAGVLSASLHEHEDGAPAGDLAAALRRAQLAARAQGRAGWEAFRAFVR